MNNKLTQLLLVPVLSLGALLAAPAPSHAADMDAVIVKSVNMRSTPSTSGSIVRLLKTGEAVDVVNKINSYWYQVRDSRGQVGYVSTSSSYIRVEASAPAPTAPAPSQNSPAPAQTQTSGMDAIVLRGVNMRSAPNTSGSVVRLLKAGEAVDIVSKVNTYWYQIRDSRGQAGYVSTSSSYLKVTGSVPSTPAAPAPAPAPAPVSIPAVKPITVSDAAQRVITAGKSFMGTPYEYGSSRSTTTTFDCSDFVRQSFLDGIGLRLPADSRQQGEYVKAIGKTSTDWRQLKPGDIIFFMSYKGYKASDYSGIDKSAQRITHDAIYLGDGKILHTYSKDSGGVRIDTIGNNSWEYRVIFGGSAL